MAYQFSENCKYFSHISNDGKLRIWDTTTNTLEQEFTPEYHLTAPCKCIQFVNLGTSKKEGSPRKKKKRDTLEISSPQIVLGTSSGKLLLYSIAKADLEFSIDSNLNQSINCVSWSDGTCVYTGINDNAVCWDLERRSIIDKWKAGNEQLTSILKIPNSNKLLTASRSIKLWNSSSKQLLHIYTGHSHDVMLLHYVNPRTSGETYFISGSKGDRLLSCWSLNENTSDESSLVSFLLDDVPQDISVTLSSDGSTCMSATTKSGVVHIFKHTLNGRSSKPLKAKQTIQVVTDSTETNGTVAPIPILCAKLVENLSLLIGHGNYVTITFEKVIVTDHVKVQCIIRKDPRVVQKKKSKEKNVSKVKTPNTNDVHYLTPFTTSKSNNAVKRRNDGTQEVPMEKRLENLTLNKLETPQGENLAHLLVQGLHSKDKFLLSNVFQRKDENVIKNTVARLPLSAIIPLVEQITEMIQGKTLSTKIGTLWLHFVIQNHASLLISNSNITSILAPIIGNIESRLSLQVPLSRLKGRLHLLLSQVTSFNMEKNNLNEQPLFVYNDKASNDLDVETLEFGHNESDNEWLEESSEDESKAVKEDEEMENGTDSELSN